LPESQAKERSFTSIAVADGKPFAGNGNGKDSVMYQLGVRSCRWLCLDYSSKQSQRFDLNPPKAAGYL
jgi:hypothetical protein